MEIREKEIASQGYSDLLVGTVIIATRIINLPIFMRFRNALSSPMVEMVDPLLSLGGSAVEEGWEGLAPL